MSNLPEPLTPAGCDLRDFPWMPIVVPQLTKSKAWSICKRKPELAFYMLNLWMASWHSVPAASLEDDDDVLCDAAMCDPKRWQAVREQVMRNWVKCSDELLYHPTVAKEALSSWEKKSGQIEAKEGEKERQRRHREERKKIFDQLRERGIEVSWNATTTHLKELLSRACHGDERDMRDTARDSHTPDTAKTRPDQTRPDQTFERERRAPGADAPAASPAQRGFRIPDDWRPSPDDESFARGLGLNVARVAALFRDYWRAKAGADAVSPDWSAKWRTWCRREEGAAEVPAAKSSSSQAILPENHGLTGMPSFHFSRWQKLKAGGFPPYERDGSDRNMTSEQRRMRLLSSIQSEAPEAYEVIIREDGDEGIAA